MWETGKNKEKSSVDACREGSACCNKLRRLLTQQANVAIPLCTEKNKVWISYVQISEKSQLQGKANACYVLCILILNTRGNLCCESGRRFLGHWQSPLRSERDSAYPKHCLNFLSCHCLSLYTIFTAIYGHYQDTARWLWETVSLQNECVDHYRESMLGNCIWHLMFSCFSF